MHEAKPEFGLLRVLCAPSLSTPAGPQGGALLRRGAQPGAAGCRIDRCRCRPWPTTCDRACQQCEKRRYSPAPTRVRLSTRHDVNNPVRTWTRNSCDHWARGLGARDFHSLGIHCDRKQWKRRKYGKRDSGQSRLALTRPQLCVTSRPRSH